jgi:ABC-type antimicrobial peptide transport system permease subunit
VVLGIGSAIGGLISLPLLRLLSPLAIERSSIDSSAFLFAAALLILISICASFSPARRVARMDPSTVLRHD